VASIAARGRRARPACPQWTTRSGSWSTRSTEASCACPNCNAATSGRPPASEICSVPFAGGYPSGTILVWKTSEDTPAWDLAVDQLVSALGTHKLLLDGQQCLTSLSAVLRGEPLRFKNRVRPVEIAFNLDHQAGPPTEVTEVTEVDDDDQHRRDRVDLVGPSATHPPDNPSSWRREPPGSPAPSHHVKLSSE